MIPAATPEYGFSHGRVSHRPRSPKICCSQQWQCDVIPYYCATQTTFKLSKGELMPLASRKPRKLGYESWLS